MPKVDAILVLDGDGNRLAGKYYGDFLKNKQNVSEQNELRTQFEKQVHMKIAAIGSTRVELGAEIVKIFPAQVLGSAFVKALKAPMPHTSVMATGGVELTESSLNEWFEAGVTCVGIGGKLVSKEMLETKNFEPLTNTLSQFLKLVGTIKMR